MNSDYSLAIIKRRYKWSPTKNALDNDIQTALWNSIPIRMGCSPWKVNIATVYKIMIDVLLHFRKVRVVFFTMKGQPLLDETEQGHWNCKGRRLHIDDHSLVTRYRKQRRHCRSVRHTGRLWHCWYLSNIWPSKIRQISVSNHQVIVWDYLTVTMKFRQRHSEMSRLLFKILWAGESSFYHLHDFATRNVRT